MNWRARYLYLAAMIFLAGCATMDVKDFSGTKPEFTFEDYFSGRTRGYGIVEDRWGNVRRQFVVDLEGGWSGEVFELREAFVFDDGEQQKRFWQVSKADAHHYVARAGDVIGVNDGESFGQAANWHYTLRVPISGREWALAMDDWMFLQPDDVLLNRVRMSKWGITVGRMLITFRRMA